jgi:arylsulfatase A-like enzyme
LTEPIHPSADLSFVAFAAFAAGFADATLVSRSLFGAAGAFQYVPSRLWVVAPLCWLAAALVLSVPSYVVSRQRGAALTVVAMAALFLYVRLSGQTPVRTAVAVVVMIVATGIVSRAAKWWLASPRRGSAVLAIVAAAALLAGTVVLTRADRIDHAGVSAVGPDVLVVFIDTVPYDSLFQRGTAVDPQFPFLAEQASRSIIFDRAYTPSPWTLPAHFSAVTGVPAHRLGISFDHQRYDGGSATLAGRMRRRGYRTAAVISNTFLNRGTGFARGFDTYEHASNALDVCRTAPGAFLDRSWPWFAASICNWTAGEVTRRASLQIAREDRRPLFLLLNYMDAHDPYYVERGCGPPAGGTPLPREVAPEEYRRRYYESHLAAIRCIDARLGELVGQLQRRKRGPVIAVLADHGEQFGEHGLVRHGNSLFDRLLHVPFMVSGPGVRGGHISQPVSIDTLPDILMKVIDGAPPGVAKGAVVSSLRPPGATPQREQWSVIRDRWHLVRSVDSVALYDLVSDPAESRNLASSPAAPLRELQEELTRESKTRVKAPEAEFRSVGYIH